jgi:hypothetical protein
MCGTENHNTSEGVEEGMVAGGRMKKRLYIWMQL